MRRQRHRLPVQAHFKRTAIEFERAPREAGATKYTLRRMTRLALNALIGFSDAKEVSPIDAILLSNDRADFIAQQLNRAGAAVRRVRGMADAAPVASNDDERGRSRNRRVEVWVKPRAVRGDPARP